MSPTTLLSATFLKQTGVIISNASHFMLISLIRQGHLFWLYCFTVSNDSCWR